MANYFITGDTLTAIADAIRSKTNTSEQILARDFALKINNLELGANLPELTNQASAAEVFSGYQYITQEGTSATGTFTIEEEINTQDSLLSQIIDTLKTRVVNAAGLLDSEYEADTATLKLTLTEESLLYPPEKYHMIYPPEALTNIGQLNFKANATLTAVNLPTVTTLENYTFSTCPVLETAILSAATAIPVYCFSNCSNLKKVELAAATQIGNVAFGDCSSLDTLILRNKDAVMTLGSTNAFSNTPIANKAGYIYVPRDLLESYKVATNWSTYSSQFRAIEDYNGVTWESFNQEKPLSANLSASSTYSSSYAVGRLIDGKNTVDYSWASSNSVTEAWIKINMQYPVRNITAHIWNRPSTVNGPIAGRIEGSHNGEDWVTLTTFSDRAGNEAELLTDHACNNTEAYQYIRLFFTDWAKASTSATYCALGEIAISGERQVGF